MHRLAAIAATATVLIANQSQAQTRNNLLRGVTAIELLIEEFNHHSADCGITENAIRASAMYPLSAAKIRVNPLGDVTLYVAIDSLYIEEERLCFSSIRMEAYIPQHVTLEFSDRRTFAPVRLWQSIFVASSGQSRHAKQVSDVVEDLAKKFLTDWNLDNKPEARTSRQGHDSDSEERTISSGTAFAVTQAGDLVTNEHVVSKCSTVTVKQGNREFIGTISFRDSAADLALIHLIREMPSGSPANLRPPPAFATLRQSPAVKPGEQVIAYGFPLRGALADEGNLTIGNVSAMRGLNNDPNEIQISAPVQPGNSGGPLLDSSGNVIGVVASKLDALNALARSGDLPQNVNFAISLPVLKAFLARSGVHATESASRFELRPDEVGEQARSFTYAVECVPRAVARAAEQRGADLAALKAAIPPASALAQKVVLYEEDQSNPNGTEFVGSAVWRTERVAASPGQKPDVVVRAEIEIPELRVSVRLSVRRNDDKSLPASHTIEIVFTLPPDFPHGSISNIPGVLMKQWETTRGVPLNGVAVKAATNFFLIGLSAVDVDMQRNVQLLKERSWFDIPVVYGDGKRAIIAIEKGTPGERAFADAFAAWGDPKGGKASALPKSALQPAR